MVGVVILMFVGVFAAIVVLGVAQSAKVGEVWGEVGQRLGLVYDRGSTFKGRSLSGRLRENEVLVDTFTRSSGKSSTTFTRYRIRYPRPLGLGLKLSREGFFSGVSKAFGAQDIQVGDATFDQGVMVKGDNPAEVVRFLTLARRARIHRALMSFSGLKISDHEIYFERTGMESSATRLTDTLQRLSLLAWFLCGDRTEDKPLEEAAQARLEGRLDEAIEAVRKVPAVDKVMPVEARLMEAHMLHLGGRKEEAGRILDEVAQVAPDDEEVKAWTERRDARPPPLPPQAEEEPEETPSAMKGESSAETPPEDTLSVETVCSDVFKTGATSADADATFTDTYAGRRVTWSGVLRSYQSSSFDFVFGDKPCTKATLDIHELTGDMLGAKKVRAIVQLPPEAKEVLQNRAGKTVTFSGELLKVDGLMKNLFLRDGVLR
jgi:hypothetical protein